MKQGGQLWSTKYILLMLYGALKMAWPYDYGKRMLHDSQNWW